MKQILSIITLLSIFALSFAQIDRTKPPKPGPAPEIQIGEYQSFTLDNGLKVFLVENHKIPRVSYSMVFHHDPVLEEDNVGYIGLAGAVIGTKTKTRTKEQLNEEVDFIGATLNAGAGSVYGAALKKHNEKLLELMADVVLNSVLTQEELDKSKKQTLSALKANKNDPDNLSAELSSVIFYGKDHPYGEIRTEESVESVTLDMCQDYYETYYSPGIAYLAIVGDITRKEAEPLIKKYFGEWENSDVPGFDYEQPTAPAENTVIVYDRPAAVQSVVNVGYPVELKVGSEDYIKASIMNTILGGGTYRLFHNLRETHGWTYGAYSSLNSDRLVGNFQAQTSVRNEVTDSAVYEILKEMKRLQTEPVPQEELQRVKNYRSGNFALALERPETVAQFALNIARYDLPENYYKDYLKNLNAVTSEDVMAMANEYMRPEGSYIFVVGKADEIAEPLARFDETIEYIDDKGNFYNPEDASAAVGEMTADEVIENYIDAIGGREKLQQIENLHMKATMTTQGMDLNMELFQTTDGKYLMSVTMGGNVMQKQVYDGEKAQAMAMGQQQEVTGEDLERMKLQAQVFPELQYDEKDYKLELKGVEEVDGDKAFRVNIINPLGDMVTEYFDTQTGLKLKSTAVMQTQMGEMTQETIYGEYKEYNGIMFPTSLEQTVGPQMVTTKVDELNINTEIPEGTFSL